jgi:hypothetical protein
LQKHRSPSKNDHILKQVRPLEAAPVLLSEYKNADLYPSHVKQHQTKRKSRLIRTGLFFPTNVSNTGSD